jgi:hypothetical protein
LAEDARFGVDPLHAERQRWQERLLELATSADALTNFWREARGKSAVLAPGLPPFPVPFKNVLQFEALNESQARFLRQIADPPPPITPISRQSRSKQRDRTRESGVFMRKMVEYMLEICGKPRNAVVATLTRIAFPPTVFSTDDVRVATQPTTRSGRSRKTDALSAKKGG